MLALARNIDDLNLCVSMSSLEAFHSILFHPFGQKIMYNFMHIILQPLLNKQFVDMEGTSDRLVDDCLSALQGCSSTPSSLKPVMVAVLELFNVENFEQLNCDVSIMKEELTKIKENISILRNERVALEESLVVLRSSLEEKTLEVEAFNVKFGCNDSSNVSEKSEGLTNVPHENSSNEILKSSLVETCTLLSMKTSQLLQLDKELEKARRIEMLLEKEVVQRDKQSASPQEDVEQLSQAEVIQSKGSENKLWYKEDQAPQIINLESKIASLEKYVAELQMMLDIASSKYEANRDYIEDLEVSLAAATKINEEFVEKRLGMLLSKIESAEHLAHERELFLEEAKCNHASIVEKLEESLTAANAVNEELKNDLSIIQEERDSTALAIESYKSTLGELEQKLNNELAKHEETKEELVRTNSVREGSSLYANRDIQKLKKKLKEAESSRDKMKKTAETTVQRYSLLEQSLSEVEKDLHAKTEELEGSLITVVLLWHQLLKQGPPLKLINFTLTYYLAVCLEYLENVGRT
jgi:hypothetical protein